MEMEDYWGPSFLLQIYTSLLDCVLLVGCVFKVVSSLTCRWINSLSLFQLRLCHAEVWQRIRGVQDDSGEQRIACGSSPIQHLQDAAGGAGSWWERFVRQYKKSALGNYCHRLRHSMNVEQSLVHIFHNCSEIIETIIIDQLGCWL